jgi:hypothetical protein
MTPGDAYWVGAARPRKPAHTPLVVVSHRTIVNNNLPVSYLCTQPEVPSGGSRRRRAVAAMALRRTRTRLYPTSTPSRRWRLIPLSRHRRDERGATAYEGDTPKNNHVLSW